MGWCDARKCITIGITLSALCGWTSCRREPAPAKQTQAVAPSAPDLTNCTRMETRFLQPVMDVFSFIWGKAAFINKGGTSSRELV
jgi:hypothetical protein